MCAHAFDKAEDSIWRATKLHFLHISWLKRSQKLDLYHSTHVQYIELSNGSIPPTKSQVWPRPPVVSNTPCRHSTVAKDWSRNLVYDHSSSNLL